MKLSAIFLLISILLSLSPLNLFAADLSLNLHKTDMSYLSFGGSIAHGISLDDPDSQRFSSILADSIQYSCTDCSATDMNADDLINAILSGAYDAFLPNANIVSITVESPDFSDKIFTIASLISQMAPLADIYFIDFFNLLSPDLSPNLSPNQFSILNFPSSSTSLDSSQHSSLAQSLAALFNIPIVTDIHNHWGELFIREMLQLGLYDNLISQSFKPDSPITRATFITLLGRLFGVNISNYTGNVFKDVTNDMISHPYVTWAWKLGIAKGTSSSFFSPNAFITREEIAVMLQRCLIAYNLVPSPSSLTLPSFSDSDSIDSWALSAASLMQSLSIIKGDQHNCFNPLLKITNAEAATIFFNLNFIFNVFHLYN